MENNFIETKENTISQEFRKNHIGGSDMGAILGLNPDKSAYELWLEKTGKILPPETNELMFRGKALEEEARNNYIKSFGTSVYDKNFLYKPWSVLSCSLDGITMDYSLIYEVKCPFRSKLYEDAINNNIIPEKYMAQVQTYLFIINTADSCDFHIYLNKNESFIINIKREEKYQKIILQKAKEFWDMVQTKTPPKRIEGDPFYLEETDNINIAEKIKERTEKIKALENENDKDKEKLKNIIEEYKYVIFGSSGIYAKKIEREGTIDWNQYKKDFNIDENILNNYRKKTTSYISYKY